MLAADPDAVRSSGMSTRKAATLRAVAQRFVDGRLSDEALSGMSDEDVVAALTAFRGSDHGRRTASCSSRSTDPTCS